MDSLRRYQFLGFPNKEWERDTQIAKQQQSFMKSEGKVYAGICKESSGLPGDGSRARSLCLMGNL
jgi:hypothetical protein